LQQQQINLNRSMLDFNRRMNRINFLLAGTQAAIGIGKAIGDYHSQQASLDIQTGTAQYQKTVDEAIVNGYDPYETELIPDTDKNGNPITREQRRYKGFDGYRMEDGRTLGELKQEIISKAAGRYWTDRGSDRGMQIAANAFENIEGGAQRQLAGEVMKNRQEVFNQELNNAIETFRKTGDPFQLNSVIESATWMSRDQKIATRLDAERKAKFLNINDTAMSIAQSQGMEPVNTYLDEELAKQNINETQKAEILVNADKGRDEVLGIRRDAVNQEWKGRLAEIKTFNLGRLLNERKILQSQENTSFKDLAPEYSGYMREIDGHIAQIKEVSNGSGSGTSNSEVFINSVHRSYGDWAAGKINRTEAIGEMFSITPPSEAAYKVRDDLFAKILDADDGSHLTSGEFTRLTETLTEWKVDQAVIDGYRENFMSMRGDEFTPQTAKLYVDGVLDKTIATRISKLYKNPEVGLSTKEENEILTAMNTGKLDVVQYPKLGRYGQREEAAYIPGGETLQARATGIARSEVESQITATGWEITGEGIELKKGNKQDNTGQVYHKLENADTRETATVRVNVDDKGNRVLEKKTDEGWVSFDSDLRAGRNEKFKQLEDEMGPDANTMIDSAIGKYAGTYTNSRTEAAALNTLKGSIMDAMGVSGKNNLEQERGLTDLQRAYLEAKVKEARQWRAKR